jgi:thioredoxin 1
MGTLALNQTNFKETIQSGIVLVDFWAPWCGPCAAFAPTFEKVSEANPGLTFARVNTEEEAGLAAAFGIQAIPTLMAFRDGNVVFSQPGALPGHALQHLVDNLKSAATPPLHGEATA